MKRPTPEQIAKEIERLRAVQTKVPRRGFMGNNFDAIGAQITTLQERLDNDGVYDKFEDKEEPEGDGLHILTNALDALQWLEGTSDERPSKGWEDML